MKEKFMNALINLIKVISIITFLAFGAFFVLSVNEQIDIDNFMLILGMISTYFFSRKNVKTDE